MSKLLKVVYPTMSDYDAAHENGRDVVCNDWNDQFMQPQAMYDAENNTCLGLLMPVDFELVKHSNGIQPWSRKVA